MGINREFLISVQSVLRFFMMKPPFFITLQKNKCNE